MKTLKAFLFLVFTTLFLTGCDTCTKQITKAQDYNTYLNSKENKGLTFATNELNFWQKKFDGSPDQISYLSQIAANYSILFEYTGKSKFLHKSVQLLTIVNKSEAYTKVLTIRALARNYISQHRFKEALVLANKALVIGEGRKETQKLLFDVQLQLGNYTEAEKNLNAIKDMHGFDYLIRLAKWNEHKGDLETAITFMEKARDIAEKEDNKELKIRTYSDLGDFYGHAGRLGESYDSFLQALALDAHYSYALKGIAWIVFSKERNTKEATRIIDAIIATHPTPDFYVLKSQIAQFEKNKSEEMKNKNAYFSILKQNDFGAMYNKYTVLIYAEDRKTVNKALEIAKVEVENRPTPDSYDLLAWSYLKSGEKTQALTIAQNHIIGKSFDPIVKYHVAMIYKANNLTENIKQIKEELAANIYELGPNFEHNLIKL